MNKTSSFERVVGRGSGHEKRKIIQESDAQFVDQQFDDLLGKEREKTLKELQIINLANQYTNEVRLKYDLPIFNIPPENIHIIKSEKWPKEESAFYSSMIQAVALQEQHSSIVFMKKVIHEMLHFKSYNALQIINNEDADVREYRVGLTVSTRDGESMYFRGLNEAVTEEMTKNIILELVRHPLFAEEIAETRKIMRNHSDAKMSNGEYLFSNDTFYAEMESGSNDINTEIFTNARERKILNILINKLFERSNKKFRNRSDVFEVFSEAMMTGNIIPLGKLVDGVFGRGTFLKIGELDGKIQEQENFIIFL